jgi:lipopolysaccharide transport system ATP-binding protein
VLTGRENLEHRLSLMGWPESRIRESSAEIVEYAGLEEFIDAPAGTYSTGMKVRLGLSIFASLRPELLLVDEALGGGDVRFRLKFREYVEAHLANGGAMLLVSHDLASVQSLCQRVFLLDRGRVHAAGAPDEVIHAYLDLMKLSDLPRKQRRPRTLEAAPAGTEGERRGGPKVVIKEAAVEAKGAASIQTLGEVQIRMTCDARRPVDAVLWVIEVGSGDVFPLATSIGGYQRELRLEPGENVFECSVAPLPLLPGVYQLRVALRERDTGWPIARKGYLDAPFGFEVHGPADPGLNLAREKRGFVNLPVRWE